tara:strand:+ start:2474 stop:3262 length:789 start_codon:yes stop_codon:yes gene_type:complete
MSYDVVVSAGCSFMNGDAILSKKDGLETFVGYQYRPGDMLSKKLKCDYQHLAGSGKSNPRIIREVVEWVESNQKTGHYEKPLIVIGLSELSRYPFKSVITGNYFDLQPGQIDSYSDTSLSKLNLKVTGGLESDETTKNWIKYYMKFLFDEHDEREKLKNQLMMLHHYLKRNNCDYRIHNSLQDSLDDIKDKINFISFNDEDYKGGDSWREFLMWQVNNIDGEDYYNKEYRSPLPPYGKRFCNGHPSPNANKELAQRIFEDLK